MSKTPKPEQEFRVVTFFYPDDGLCLAYTRYDNPRSPYRVEHVIRATSGTEAKKIAMRLRKEKERGRGEA